MRRVSRRCLVAAVALALGLAAPTAAGAQEGEGEGDGFVPGDATTVPVPPVDPSVPEPTIPPTTLPPDAPTTTALPAGCSPPPVPHAQFSGELTAADERTARFRVIELTGGSLSGFQVGDLVDVDFDDDTRYLDVGDEYFVAAGIDDDTGRLRSKVTEDLPMFGGDQVVGVDDRDVVCPTFDDPVITTMIDGASVESGVLAPMFERPRDLLSAFARPAGVAFAALVVLVALKRSLAWSSRRMRRMWRHRRAVRVLASTRRSPSSPSPQPR